MYFCDKCEYVTNNKTNYNKHENTKKHKINTKKIFVCDFCDAEFMAQSTFYYHMKKCKVQIISSNIMNNLLDNDNTVQSLKNVIMQKDHIIELEQLKVKYEKEKVEILEKVVNNSNKTTDKALNITEGAVSAIKYANAHYNNAPKLEPITNFNLWGYKITDENEKKLLIDTLLYHSRQNSVHKVFGEHIISLYKKKNIKDQSMHTTDTSRMNYIIRAEKGDLLKWVTDKNGVKICEVIIEPIIATFVDILRTYQQELIDVVERDPLNVSKETQSKIHNIIQMLLGVDNGELKKETNKYIAPYFNIDK